jgi:hypothetical protein
LFVDLKFFGVQIFSFQVISVLLYLFAGFVSFFGVCSNQLGWVEQICMIVKVDSLGQVGLICTDGYKGVVVMRYVQNMYFRSPYFYICVWRVSARSGLGWYEWGLWGDFLRLWWLCHISHHIVSLRSQ